MMASVTWTSVRNNSLSQDISRRKILFVSACFCLYGKHVWMKLNANVIGKLLIYIYNLKNSINFAREFHLCLYKFHYIPTVYQPTFWKLFHTLLEPRPSLFTTTKLQETYILYICSFCCPSVTSSVVAFCLVTIFQHNGITFTW